MRTLKLAGIAALLAAAAFAGRPSGFSYHAFLPSPDATTERAVRVVHLIVTGERPDGTVVQAGADIEGGVRADGAGAAPVRRTAVVPEPGERL